MKAIETVTGTIRVQYRAENWQGIGYRKTGNLVY